MIKLFGIIFISVGTVYLTVSYKKSLCRNVLLARDMQAFVRFAHDAIKRRVLPVPMILSEYARESVGFGHIYVNAFEKTLGQAIAELDCDARTAKIMASFACEFGQSETAPSLALCTETEAKLSQLIQTLDTEAYEKGSVFTSSAMFIAVSVILLLF